MIVGKGGKKQTLEEKGKLREVGQFRGMNTGKRGFPGGYKTKTPGKDTLMG